MSRSFKKNNIVKDKGVNDYNKRLRRTNKIRVTQGKDPLDTSEITNDWDIEDWRFISKDLKDKRK